MCLVILCVFLFFFKQKTAYEMRISDWSSDVCSSDLRARPAESISPSWCGRRAPARAEPPAAPQPRRGSRFRPLRLSRIHRRGDHQDRQHRGEHQPEAVRSEEHTSELQSLMRISYAVFCLKKKKLTNDEDRIE